MKLDFFKKKSPASPAAEPAEKPSGKSAGSGPASSKAGIVLCIAGCLAGMYIGSSEPNLFRGILGEEELVSKSACMALEASAKAQAARAKTQEPQTRGTSPGSAPQMASPGSSSVTLSLEEVGKQPGRGNILVKSDNVGVASSVLPKVVMDSADAPIAPLDFANVTIDPAAVLPSGQGVEVFTSFTCAYCQNAHAVLQALHDRFPEVPVRYIFLSQNDDDVRLFMTWALLDAVSKEEGSRFLNYVYSSGDRKRSAQLISGYSRINPSFRPDDILAFWRGHRDLLQQLVDASADAAGKYGVDRTPTFLVDGEILKHEGEIGVQTLRDDWLAKGKK